MSSGTDQLPALPPRGDEPGRSDRLVNPWVGSRASIMVLVSVILVLVATVIMYFANNKEVTDVFLRMLVPIADAMLVVSVTVLLTELGPFRNYVEERLQSLKQVLDRPVLERLTDSCYLRQNFTPDLIKRMQKASTCASLPAQIKDYPEFLKVIDKYVIPFAVETIWRRDFRVNISDSIYQENGHTLIRRKTALSAVYVNTGDGDRTMEIPITRTYSKLPGVADDQLCCNGWAKVKPEGAYTETTFMLNFEPTDLGDSVRFESKFSITVGKAPVFVSTGYDAIVGPNETHRQSLSVPTAGLTVTYAHPSEIKPELLCFGVGGELRTIVADEMQHQWEHTGTFLPTHGAVLTHSWARRKADRKAVPQKESATERAETLSGRRRA
jgi:hypothetical protein